MDSIDALLAERIIKPVGIASGEAAVYNGTAFVRSTVTKLEPASINVDWVDYSPTWTSTGTQPVLNNGTLTGRYAVCNKLVHVAIALTMGAGTTFGTGDYIFSLPVAGHASRPAHGSAFGVDSSPANSYSLISRWNGTNLRCFTTASPNAAVGQLVPITWASGDLINLSLTYEAA